MLTKEVFLMFRFSKIKYLYFCLLSIITIATVIFSIYFYPFETKDLITFIVTVVTLLVSLFGFYISLKTYLSIDSVNILTQMEGNVLENENYVSSITSMLMEFKQKDAVEVGESIFEELEERFKKKSNTAIEFANNLQYFVDVIVLFPFLFNKKSPELIERMKKLLDLIEDIKTELVSISNGNLILIEETVKLITSVVNYQKLIRTDNYKISSAVLMVKGSMLRNAVTQTVYFNYLGLFYNKKAMNIIRKRYDMWEEDFFEIDVLKNIHKKAQALNEEDKELFVMYLKESLKAFQVALDSSNEDVMWEGFIKYNQARSTYFLQLVDETYKGTNWESIINEAIRARGTLNHLLRDTLDGKDQTYLQEAFIAQEYLARFVKLNLQVASNDPITDSFGSTKYTAPSYDGLPEDPLLVVSLDEKLGNIFKYQRLLRGIFER